MSKKELIFFYYLTVAICVAITNGGAYYAELKRARDVIDKDEQ